MDAASSPLTRARFGQGKSNRFGSTSGTASIRLDTTAAQPTRDGTENAMPAKLVVLAGPDEGKVFAISADSAVTIGRGEAAHVRLADPAISRAHCILEYFGGTAILKDNSSKTGTRINGKAIIEHPLQPDEVINVGTTKICFQLLSQPATAKP
jgi:pSer/pThr/pTyr-binding forkhead associated (FHA) protein